MVFPKRVVDQAAQRWRTRQSQREQRTDSIRHGRITDAETPERIQRRLERLAKLSNQTPARPAAGQPTLVERIGLERVLGKADFVGMQFMEMALAISRFVGRVHIRRAPGRTAGFGTGFMVSPCLLLTNNHVLPTAELAAHSEIEFDYQYDSRGRLLPVVAYGFEPASFFLTDETLDYTLVAVRQMSQTGTDLRLYGWNRLDPQQGKALLGDPLNITQHPRGEAKQIVLRSNHLVDLLDDFAHYATDTEPGSSGSPVYNDQWEVVALHHSGVPKMDADGQYLAKDGSIWHDGMDAEDLDWVANEGVRVSSLIAHVEQQSLPNDDWRRLRADMFERRPPDPMEAAAMAAAAASTQVSVMAATPDMVKTAMAQTLDVTIPIHVSIRVGETVSAQAAVVQAPRPPATGGAKPPAADPAGLAEALARLEEARRREYYDAAADAKARREYYKTIAVDGQSGDAVYRALSTLLKRTHTKVLSYSAARQQHLYTVVDLHRDGRLRSIYTRDQYRPEDILREDFEVTESLKVEALKRFGTTPARASFIEEQFEQLEAATTYNAEHVVPQSWFAERLPMKSDLHHLFTCEVVCNSFRGNTPYSEFADFGETDRVGCGRRVDNRFEPAFGHGPVARATLYFLLRYPGEINANAKEYTKERLAGVMEWHRRDPVTEFERHRNAEIQRAQGNRNPLIDFPEWAEKIDFALGLGRA